MILRRQIINLVWKDHPGTQENFRKHFFIAFFRLFWIMKKLKYCVKRASAVIRSRAEIWWIWNRQVWDFEITLGNTAMPRMFANKTGFYFPKDSKTSVIFPWNTEFRVLTNLFSHPTRLEAKTSRPPGEERETFHKRKRPLQRLCSDKFQYTKYIDTRKSHLKWKTSVWWNRQKIHRTKADELRFNAWKSIYTLFS